MIKWAPWLVVLIVIGLGVYKYSEYKIFEQAYTHPQIKLVEVTRTVIRKAIVIHERIVEKPGGERIIERFIEDKSKEETASNKAESTQVVLPPSNNPLLHIYASYQPLTSQVALGLGINVFAISAGVAVPISPSFNILSPTVYGLVRF